MTKTRFSIAITGDDCRKKAKKHPLIMKALAALALVMMGTYILGDAVYYTTLFSKHGNPWALSVASVAVVLSSFGAASLIIVSGQLLFDQN